MWKPWANQKRYLSSVVEKWLSGDAHETINAITPIFEILLSTARRQDQRSFHLTTRRFHLTVHRTIRMSLTEEKCITYEISQAVQLFIHANCLAALLNFEGFSQLTIFLFSIPFFLMKEIIEVHIVYQKFSEGDKEFLIARTWV